MVFYHSIICVCIETKCPKREICLNYPDLSYYFVDKGNGWAQEERYLMIFQILSEARGTNFLLFLTTFSLNLHDDELFRMK